MSTLNRSIEKCGFTTRYSPELFNVSEENKFHKSGPRTLHKHQDSWKSIIQDFFLVEMFKNVRELNKFE